MSNIELADKINKCLSCEGFYFDDKSQNCEKIKTELMMCDLNIPKFSFFGKVFLVKVVRCYDGDTLYCAFKIMDQYQQFTVRMIGYNSSEIKQKKSLPDEERESEKKLAIVAKLRLEELVLGKLVYLYCYKFDNFGRILGVIKINQNDEKSVNQIMIDDKMGELFFTARLF